MAKKLQWVNYPDADKTIGSIAVTRSKLVESDVTSVAEMGRNVYIAVKFKKKDKSQPATLTVKPAKGNAKYTPTEWLLHPGLFAPTLATITKVGSNGVAKFAVILTPGGGDLFEFKAKSAKGTEIACSDEIETRRKLFYQMIRMRRARQLGAAMLARFEKQFWREKERVYIKLEQYSPGKTIKNKANFDDYDPAALTALKDAARKAYDKSKAPFAVAVVVVNKNCNPGPEVGAARVVFNGGSFRLTLTRPLFYYADPAVPWFSYMTFTPDGGAAPLAIPQSAVKILGRKELEIDTKALPHGAGRLNYEVQVIMIAGLGLSLPTENLVTIASRRSDDSKVPIATMAALLTHEVGHKVGMVPGPEGDHDLDQQSSYYDHRGHFGPHCRHPAPLLPTYSGINPVPAPKCTMFGDIRTNTAVFCSKCIKSVRKLDVNPERKVGLAKQF